MERNMVSTGYFVLLKQKSKMFRDNLFPGAFSQHGPCGFY